MSPMLLPASEGRSIIGGFCACAPIPGVTVIHCAATITNAAKTFKRPLVSVRTRLFVIESSFTDFVMRRQNAQNVGALEFCGKFHFSDPQRMAGKESLGIRVEFAQRRPAEFL